MRYHNRPDCTACGITAGPDCTAAASWTRCCLRHQLQLVKSRKTPQKKRNRWALNMKFSNKLENDLGCDPAADLFAGWRILFS